MSGQIVQDSTSQVSFPTAVWTRPLCFKRKAFSHVEVSCAASLALEVREKVAVCFIFTSMDVARNLTPFAK